MRRRASSRGWPASSAPRSARPCAPFESAALHIGGGLQKLRLDRSALCAANAKALNLCRGPLVAYRKKTNQPCSHLHHFFFLHLQHLFHLRDLVVRDLLQTFKRGT